MHQHSINTTDNQHFSLLFNHTYFYMRVTAL